MTNQATMITKKFKISSCMKCPHWDEEIDSDGKGIGEIHFKWYCKLSKLHARRHVSAYDEKNFIPKWCNLANY